MDLFALLNKAGLWAPLLFFTRENIGLMVETVQGGEDRAKDMQFA